MRIYLDHNATTPVDPAAADAMMRAAAGHFGNPSSVHYFGQQAKAALDEARSAVAALIGAEPSEIVFTSGGTEADNFAIRGVGGGARGRPAGEHLDHVGHRARGGAQHVQGARDGAAGRRRCCRSTRSGIVVARRARARRMTDDTALVSIMHANNEIGTIQPIAELARDRARARRAVSHRRGADGRQDSGRRARRSASTCCRSRRTSSTARRASARCGSGAACGWRRSLTGGKQERNRRAGTENVAGIVGHGRRRAARARRRWPTRPRAWRRCAIGSRSGILRARARHGRQRRARRRACRTPRTSASTASRPSRC